jgi:uncharacterized protein HemX
MQKNAVWVLVIAAGVFLGVFAYEKFTEYRAAQALQALQQELQAESERWSMRAKAERDSKVAAENYRNTACAINEDTQTCTCIYEKTGVRISMANDDCVKRAKEITW